jgi:predicted AAA+ superfamily ATPase
LRHGVKEGVKLVFIDEIHKYPNWSQELKNIYDAFLRLKLVFSGSSSIDLIGGTHDLSRRGVLYHLRGLSFREYLNFTTAAEHRVLDLASLMEDPPKIAAEFAQIPRLRAHFRKYLEAGYYPFVFEQSDRYYEQLGRAIDKTIFEDVAQHYNLKTANLHYFKKILYFPSTIPPGQLNTHKLAGNLRIDDKTTLHYLHILQSTGLVRLVHSAQRGNRLLRNPEKGYLDNTSLLHAICSELGQQVDRGTVRELFF